MTTLRTEGVVISRQQALELLPLAQRRPSTGRWRVILVEDADRLNDSSGNAMLKAIEEPTARTVWLLCAPSADDVLVTIRSRCRHVGLRTPPPDAVADLLVRRDGVDPQMAAFAARAAQSHIGMARRLATDEQARIRRRDVLRVPLQLRGVGDAVLHAAALLDTAKAEAEAGTTQRDEAERVDLLRALGADPQARTQPPHVRSQLKTLADNQKRRATRFVRDMVDRSLLDLLSLYRDVLVLHADPTAELINAEMRPDVERLAARLSPSQARALHGRHPGRPRPDRRRTSRRCSPSRRWPCSCGPTRERRARPPAVAVAGALAAAPRVLLLLVGLLGRGRRPGAGGERARTRRP